MAQTAVRDNGARGCTCTGQLPLSPAWTALGPLTAWLSQMQLGVAHEAAQYATCWLVGSQDQRHRNLQA